MNNIVTFIFFLFITSIIFSCVFFVTDKDVNEVNQDLMVNGKKIACIYKLDMSQPDSPKTIIFSINNDTDFIPKSFKSSQQDYINNYKDRIDTILFHNSNFLKINDFQESIKWRNNSNFIERFYLPILFMATSFSLILTIGLRPQQKLSLTMYLKQLWLALTRRF